jgi:virginiamycin B lyase
MRNLTRKAGPILTALFAAMCFATMADASDLVIRGIVTDSAGKPIRGAIVKASAGILAVSRYSQNDGRYEISVPAGTYDVSAAAFGFAGKKQTAQRGDTNFQLAPRVDVALLTSAEMDSLLPDNQDTKLLRATCTGCHNLDTILHRRGMTSQQWQDFVQNMTQDRMPQPRFSARQLSVLGPMLEKYFGPDAAYFGPDADAPKLDQIKHAALSDEALKATIREYKVPTAGAWTHSLAVDATRDIAWFAEYDNQSNKVGRFNIASETFQEYPVPTPRAGPHTPAVGPDGRVWMTLNGGVPAKLVSVDPTTNQLKQYSWPEKKAGTHTVAVAPDGNLFFSAMSSPDEFLSFNVKTEQFKAYRHALPTAYPEVSAGAYEQLDTKPVGITYDVAVDSHGDAWYTEIMLGTIARLDPQTGEVSEYKPPDTPNMNGIMVDAQDNVWFSNFMGNKLGKLDVKTGKFTMYQPPTLKAKPYGIIMDKKNGYIWFADYGGNNITRFDPRTAQFVEYPIPTRGADPRFVGLDSKGRLWFAEWWNSRIGVVDPEGNQQLASK